MNVTLPMPRPGSKWRPGKKPGTWFRHVAILGPCVAENGNVTAIRHRITVPFGPKWSLAAIAAMPSETCRVSGECQGREIKGVLRLPIAARREAVWHRDGAMTGWFHLTPAPDETPTFKITGTWKQDDTDGMEAVIFAPI